MVKAIIIYESRWGNTRQVAEHIAEGMRQTRQTEVDLVEIGQVDLDVIVDFDIVKKWLKELEKRMNKKIVSLQKDFDAGLKVDIKQQDLKPIIKSIGELKVSVESGDPLSNKAMQLIKLGNDKLLQSIRKNRTTTIKTKFDKKLLKPKIWCQRFFVAPLLRMTIKDRFQSITI